MKRIITVFLAALVYIPSEACLNLYYGVDKKGHLHQAPDYMMKSFSINFNKKRQIDRLKTIEKRLEKENAYMLLSDYAVGLMKLGKTKEALHILQELYKHYPNEYRIASNLGTAYELNGEPDKALAIIKKGIELNPQDHEGSEWVHVKVLETKLALRKDPLYLQHYTVLQLSKSQEEDSIVAMHIYIQLDERFPFSPGPDPVMASILTDLGDCYSNTSSVEYARLMYEIAREYYGDTSSELAGKISNMRTLAKKYLHVKPGNTRNGVPYEGEHTKLSAYSGYKKLLSDNDKEHYRIDWSKINIDVPFLLSLIDLTMTAPEAKEQARQNGDSNGIVLMDDQAVVTQDTMVKTQTGISATKPAGHSSKACLWFLTIPAAALLVWLMVRRLKPAGHGKW